MTLPANRRFGLGVDRKFTSLFCAVAALAIIGLFAWPNPDRVAEAADVFINQNNEDTIGEDLFDTVTANGDRLYEAGEYDRAIELYEQAYARAPITLTPQSELLAHTYELAKETLPSIYSGRSMWPFRILPASQSNRKTGR